MKLWVDDIRHKPQEYDIHAKNANDAIQFLTEYDIEQISLDHDLGEDSNGLTGYDVAVWIEKAAFHGLIKKMVWYIHSANPVGRKRIEQALNNANKYWDGDL